MATVAGTSSLNKSISSRADNNTKDLLDIGNDVEKARGNFNSVVSDKNKTPGEIEVAKQAFEKQVERFKMKLAVIDTVNKLIDQIIQRIGQVGR